MSFSKWRWCSYSELRGSLPFIFRQQLATNSTPKPQEMSRVAHRSVELRVIAIFQSGGGGSQDPASDGGITVLVVKSGRSAAK